MLTVQMSLIKKLGIILGCYNHALTGMAIIFILVSAKVQRKHLRLCARSTATGDVTNPGYYHGRLREFPYGD